MLRPDSDDEGSSGSNSDSEDESRQGSRSNSNKPSGTKQKPDRSSTSTSARTSRHQSARGPADHPNAPVSPATQAMTHPQRLPALRLPSVRSLPQLGHLLAAADSPSADGSGQLGGGPDTSRSSASAAALRPLPSKPQSWGPIPAGQVVVSPLPAPSPVAQHSGAVGFAATGDRPRSLDVLPDIKAACRSCPSSGRVHATDVCIMQQGQGDAVDDAAADAHQLAEMDGADGDASLIRPRSMRRSISVKEHLLSNRRLASKGSNSLACMLAPSPFGMPKLSSMQHLGPALDRSPEPDV